VHICINNSLAKIEWQYKSSAREEIRFAGAQLIVEIRPF